jgi:hypothetical protein
MCAEAATLLMRADDCRYVHDKAVKGKDVTRSGALIIGLGPQASTFKHHSRVVEEFNNDFNYSAHFGLRSLYFPSISFPRATSSY